MWRNFLHANPFSRVLPAAAGRNFGRCVINNSLLAVAKITEVISRLNTTIDAFTGCVEKLNLPSGYFLYGGFFLFPQD